MVLCNLKARNMRGIKSDGMLLCASNDTHELVEPLMPPGDVQPGERVAYGDDETATQPEPETPNKAGYYGVHIELCLSSNITQSTAPLHSSGGQATLSQGLQSCACCIMCAKRSSIFWS